MARSRNTFLVSSIEGICILSYHGPRRVSFWWEVEADLIISAVGWEWTVLIYCRNCRRTVFSLQERFRGGGVIKGWLTRLRPFQTSLFFPPYCCCCCWPGWVFSF